MLNETESQTRESRSTASFPRLKKIMLSDKYIIPKSLALAVFVIFAISGAAGNKTSYLHTGQCARTVHYVETAQEALAVTRSYCTIIKHVGVACLTPLWEIKNGRSVQS